MILLSRASWRKDAASSWYPSELKVDPNTSCDLVSVLLAVLPFILQFWRADNADASGIPDWFIISLVLIMFLPPIYFRLGLVTLLVWLGTKIGPTSGTSDRPPWSAIVFSSIAFGLAHLYGAPINARTVSLVLVANGMSGTVFGRLY